LTLRAALLPLAVGAAAAIVAAATAAGDAHAAFSQAWPAFALVSGLLLVGAAAAREGVFEAAGTAVARLPGGTASLLVALLLLEAAVTAVLNLDTAVVFVTPVLLHAARQRGASEAPFLYGAVFMANSASLLLPGSNLTNLIVLANEPVTGSTFAARLAPAWAVAVAVTIVFLLLVFRRQLIAPAARITGGVAFRLGAGSVGIAVAAVLVLALSHPALPVLGVGIAVGIASRLRAQHVLDATNPALLLGVLGIAVGLGTLARNVGWLGSLVEHAGRWESAWIAAGASVLANNLPAAVVLTAHAPAHPRALLLGLDLGPNLAVTGSLSALLWLQVARANGAKPSVVRYSLLGVVLVPLSLSLALLGAAGF
jgi:arsenical pump membrane protein